MSTQKLRELIREYLKAGGGGTYDPTNPTGVIQNEKRVDDYIDIIENQNTDNGSTTLEIKVSKNINNPRIEEILNEILPVKYEIFDYNNDNSVKLQRDKVINKIFTIINNLANYESS